MPFGGGTNTPRKPAPIAKAIETTGGNDVKERIKRAQGRSGTLFSRGLLFKPTVNNSKLGGG